MILYSQTVAPQIGAFLEQITQGANQMGSGGLQPFQISSAQGAAGAAAAPTIAAPAAGQQARILLIVAIYSATSGTLSSAFAGGNANFGVFSYTVTGSTDFAQMLRPGEDVYPQGSGATGIWTITLAGQGAALSACWVLWRYEVRQYGTLGA